MTVGVAECLIRLKENILTEKWKGFGFGILQGIYILYYVK